LYALCQTVQHFPYISHLSSQSLEVARRDRIAVSCDHQMVFQFRAGIHGVSEESYEVPLTSLASTFDDICRYRHGSSGHLISKRSECRTTNPRGRSMNVERKSVSLTPDAKLAEVRHPCSLSGRFFEAPSILRHETLLRRTLPSSATSGRSQAVSRQRSAGSGQRVQLPLTLSGTNPISSKNRCLPVNFPSLASTRVRISLSFARVMPT